MKILVAFLLSLFMYSVSQASEIIFAGDVTLMRNVSASQTNFMSEKAQKLVNSADAFIYNVEFSGKGPLRKKQFVFSCDSDIIQYFNFPNSVGLVANNHSFDGSEAGFKNLVKSLDKFGMKHVGTKNIKYKNFYILGYSPMISSPLVKSFTQIVSDIKNITKKSGEYIIVCIHDGIERTYAPSTRQKQQAKILANLGVDVICYTHSHTYIEPSKIENTLVLWGMGNFVFGGNSGWRNRQDVRMLSVDMETKTYKWIKGHTRDYAWDF